MEKRCKELLELHGFIEGVDKNVKMVLEDLKWDRKRFIEDVPKVTCSYEKSHKLAPDKKECHERQCFLKSHGYDKDLLLPDPLDADANTLIKLDKQAIVTIVNNATCGNPLFKQGIRSQSPEPWTLERLQATYTMDERRAIHDAVVQAVPSCHDLADLALPSNEDGAQNPKFKSRAEILAELRDMKRRRTKYRVAAKTQKYSDVLRAVINTQMELYTDATHQNTTEPDHNKSMLSQKIKNRYMDDDENGVPSQKPETSLREDERKRRQEHNFPSNLQRRNRNTEKRISAERVGLHSRDRGERHRQDFYSNPYPKIKNRTMTQKVVTSSVEERESGNRNDYAAFRYESRRTENRPNVKEMHQSRENRERLQRNYPSSSRVHLPEDARQDRRRHDYASTSRQYENYDNETRQNIKNYTSHNSNTAMPRKRHREYNASLERDENPSKRKHKEIRHGNCLKASRKRSAGREGKIEVKLERDRDLSDNETRYDFVYTSRYKNMHKKSQHDERSREKHYHKSGNGRDRYEDDMSIKKERETPEYNETDTQSSYTRTSTYFSSRRNNYTSSSGSDYTISRRDRRIRDDYKYRHEHMNVRIKKERSETNEDEYHHHRTSKCNRKKRSRRYRSSEESDSQSSESYSDSGGNATSSERESRHIGRYKSSYGNDRIQRTCIRIKKEKDTTPPKECGKKEIRHDPQYSRNIKQERRASNNSWK